MTIRIVTDSACDVPADIAAELNITIIPVYINIGDESYLDGVELTRREFFDNLPDYKTFPTTAAPSIGTFTAVYQELADHGVDEIISIHIPEGLSATFHSARLGAAEVTGATVTLFDSMQLTMGAGLQVIMAAEAAAAGKSLSEIMALLEEIRPKAHIFAILDTLEFMRRSGRVGWAQFAAGTLLRIKPIVSVFNGEVGQAARVRTSNRAIREMLKMTTDLSPLARIAILHTHNLEGAESLKAQLQPLFPPDQSVPVMEITPAIGAHTGPNAVGVAFIRK